MSLHDRPPTSAKASQQGKEVERHGAAHPHLLIRDESRPEVIARLEWLDDLMFAAIDGDAAALQAAADAWHKTRSELGADTLEESRQQYLRCAQDLWHSLRYEAHQAPHKVFAAIEMISLLADRAH
jgi:hypothetical protein